MQDSVSILELLESAIDQMTWIEIWAVIAGLIYVILAARENIWCWFFGIINALLSIYLFYIEQLYSESMLYFYYVLAGVYGWYAWKQNDHTEREVLNQIESSQPSLEIHTWTIWDHIKAIVAGVLLALLLAFIMKNYTDAKNPLLDAFTTIFSFIATYMVTRKVLENWLYWIVIDIVTTGMYFGRGYYLYALLMIVYTVIAVIGYMNWKKLHKKAPVDSIMDD